MTREERISVLKQIEKDIHVCSIESTFLDDAKSCAIHSAIEELEQEPILNKLKAEITMLQHRCYSLTKGTMCAFCKFECEYKTESEG